MTPLRKPVEGASPTPMMSRPSGVLVATTAHVLVVPMSSPAMVTPDEDFVITTPAISNAKRAESPVAPACPYILWSGARVPCIYCVYKAVGSLRAAGGELRMNGAPRSRCTNNGR